MYNQIKITLNLEWYFVLHTSFSCGYVYRKYISLFSRFIPQIIGDICDINDLKELLRDCRGFCVLLTDAQVLIPLCSSTPFMAAPS